MLPSLNSGHALTLFSHASAFSASPSPLALPLFLLKSLPPFHFPPRPFASFPSLPLPFDRHHPLLSSLPPPPEPQPRPPAAYLQVPFPSKPWARETRLLWRRAASCSSAGAMACSDGTATSRCFAMFQPSWVAASTAMKRPANASSASRSRPPLIPSITVANRYSSLNAG